MADLRGIVLDKDKEQPLYIQLRDILRRMIGDRSLPGGEKLPPVTDFAKMLGVTPSTVRRALQDLTDEGLVDSHVGRGTFVRDRANPLALAAESGDDRGVSSIDAFRTLSELLVLARRPGVIAFTRGLPAPDTVPPDLLTRMSAVALKNGEAVYRDSGDPAGLSGLREKIAALYKTRGLAVSPEQILVTGGSQQGITLMAQYAAARSLKVFAEVPCYMGVVNAFAAFGVRTEPVERGGLPPSAVSGAAPLYYLCPAIHNPRGDDLTPAQCLGAARWSADSGSLLLVDEVFNDLRFEGSDPHPFFTDPGPDNVILAGSLSKSVTSGLRVGWLVGSEERIRTLARMKKAMDIACPPLIQGVAEAILSGDFYGGHLEAVRGHYRLRRDVLLAALEKRMPGGVSWTVPAGGFQLWLNLPEGFSSVALYMMAVSAGVAFIPGPLQHPDQGFLSSLRICYGDLTPDEIENGTERLGRVVRRLLAGDSSGAGLSGLGDFF
jgi:DNA-binding transcriptional MocR family regulator